MTSSRRYLCEKSSEDLGDTRGEWNDSLAVDPICTAYVNLLEELTGLCEPSRYDATAILPCEIPKGDVPIKLRMELLRNLVIGDAKVFTDGNQYANFSKISFLSPVLQVIRDRRRCVRSAQKIQQISCGRHVAEFA